MPRADRDEAVRRERGRGVVRALYVSEFEAVGDVRREARKLADKQLEKVARLLPDALAAGLSLSEISRLADVSRPTLYELRARLSEDDGDVRLGVLQAIANRGRVDRDAVVGSILRPTGEVASMINALIDQGFVEEDFNDQPEDPAMEIWLTPKGFALLEDWVFEEEENEELYERLRAEGEFE